MLLSLRLTSHSLVQSCLFRCPSPSTCLLWKWQLSQSISSSCRLLCIRVCQYTTWISTSLDTNLVMGGNQSISRPYGREYIPAYPQSFIALRIVQLILSVAVLGLDAYTISLYSFDAN